MINNPRPIILGSYSPSQNGIIVSPHGIHQLENDYNEVARQLDGKETHKDEDPAKLLLDNMQKMRDHCDMLEK